MSYVGITGNFHRDDRVSFHGLGAASVPDVDIDYYAPESSLRWKNNQWRNIHDDLVRLDEDWRRALRALPIEMIPDQSLRTAITAMTSFPMPIAADMALALEVIGGQRPFDEQCVQMLAFARDRLLSNAGGMAAISSTTAIIAGVLAFVGPADLGISAGSMASISAVSGVTAAVLAGLGGIVGSLAEGKKPKTSDLELMSSGAGFITGNEPPSPQAQQQAIAALADRQQSDKQAASRRAAINSAKQKSLRKRDACRAAGGVFDPRAPGGCRIINAKRVNDNLKQNGIDTGVNVGGSASGLLVPAGLAALGVVGVWLMWPKKPRSNPKPKPKRRRRRR